MVCAQDVMTTDVVWITAHYSLRDAFATMMQFNVDHLPVVEKQTVVGLISKDLVFAYAIAGNFDERLRVRDAMRKDVLTCLPHNPVARIAETMSRLRVGAMPVLQKGELVGIITTTDILHCTLASSSRIA